MLFSAVRHGLKRRPRFPPPASPAQALASPSAAHRRGSHADASRASHASLLLRLRSGPALAEARRLHAAVLVGGHRHGAVLAAQLVQVYAMLDALLTIPIATMHRDREVWCEDADEFNPMRFDAGGGGAARAARHANALLSFSMGPRTCIGQNFAMVQAKAEVAVILRRFALSLSPSYVHAPTDVITLRPKYGLPMIITRLDA